jgi:hypothetical protein
MPNPRMLILCTGNSAQSDGRSLDVDSRIREWMLEQGMKRVFPKAAVSP